MFIFGQIISSAAKLTDRYVTGKFLPDKPIDAVDEAGARSRMESLKRPLRLKSFQEIKDVCTLKETAISRQNFEEAAEAKTKKKLRQA